MTRLNDDEVRVPFQRGLILRESLERLLRYTMFAAPILCLVLVPVVYLWFGSWPAARFVALYVAPMALVQQR